MHPVLREKLNFSLANTWYGYRNPVPRVQGFSLKKKFKKNVLDIIGVLFKDESITIDIVLQLKFFLDFSRGVTPFCKNKGSQKVDPSWNFFCSEPLKCSSPNKLLSENLDLKKLN